MSVIPLYLNATKRLLMDAESQALPSTKLPRLALGTIPVWAFTVLDDDGNPVSFNADDTFALYFGPTWGAASLVNAVSPDIVLSGDDDNILTCQIDARQAGLASYLAANPEAVLYGQIDAIANGEEDPYWSGYFVCYGHNNLTSLVPEGDPSDYYTKSQIAAILAALEASDIGNDSSVTGATVKDALETIAATGGGNLVILHEIAPLMAAADSMLLEATLAVGGVYEIEFAIAKSAHVDRLYVWPHPAGSIVFDTSTGSRADYGGTLPLNDGSWAVTGTPVSGRIRIRWDGSGHLILEAWCAQPGVAAAVWEPYARSQTPVVDAVVNISFPQYSTYTGEFSIGSWARIMQLPTPVEA